jgi:hypothetical protein
VKRRLPIDSTRSKKALTVIFFVYDIKIKCISLTVNNSIAIVVLYITVIDRRFFARQAERRKHLDHKASESRANENSLSEIHLTVKQHASRINTQYATCKDFCTQELDKSCAIDTLAIKTV